jgi:hypothetical protein
MLYEQDGITVDDRFVRFGSKSYAINKINSVDVRTKKVPGSSAYILLWPIAFILILGGAGTGSWETAGFGVVLAIAGWFAWTKRHPTFLHQLYLVTSSNEAQAFETADDDVIARLRGAIEEAMSRSN